MRSVLSQAAIYLVMVVNIGLALLGFTATRSLFLERLAWLYRDGRRVDGEVVRVPAILGTFDIFFVLVGAVLAVIAAGFVYLYYSRGARKGLLGRRVVLVLGVQVLYLGAVQAGLRSVGGDPFGLGLSLLAIAALLVVGAGLVTLSLWRVARR